MVGDHVTYISPAIVAASRSKRWPRCRRVSLNVNGIGNHGEVLPGKTGKGYTEKKNILGSIDNRMLKYHFYD